jgi:16S rRNA C1402 (ribose-2'-O) methylase RsmI
MDGTGSDLCPVAGFEISHLEASECAITVFSESPHLIMRTLQYTQKSMKSKEIIYLRDIQMKFKIIY